MLSDSLGRIAEGAARIATLADCIRATSTCWGIDIADPFIDEARCPWVAPCQPSSGAPAVLKIGLLSPDALPEIVASLFGMRTRAFD